MATFHLHLHDARLVCLAIAYHLGRPGSETDATTLRRHSLGLGPVLDVLEPQLDSAAAESAVVELDLSAYQLTRLGAALHGTVNELKQYGMAEGRSAVPGFAEAFARLFPLAAAEGADGNGAGALDLVADAVGLRRRLDTAVREAEAQVEAARAAALEVAAQATAGGWWGRLRGRVAGLLRSGGE